MARSIAVIDYGMGNLRSVAKAIEHVVDAGDRVRVTDNPDQILSADRVVFPGQGAARDCMAAISDHHLNQAILDAAASKPFLGICMGLQVLMEYSEENGGTELLKLLPGQVRHFDLEQECNGQRLKIPHMGWNKVQHSGDHPLWRDIQQASRVYFLQSYFVEPQDQAIIAATTDYGVDFTSAVAKDNLFAVQFHPEKSAQDGLTLLRNFVQWDI
jgi:glutamine amidotransferase